MENFCVCCGKEITEGRQVCIECENKVDDNKLMRQQKYLDSAKWQKSLIYGDLSGKMYYCDHCVYQNDLEKKCDCPLEKEKEYPCARALNNFLEHAKNI